MGMLEKAMLTQVIVQDHIVKETAQAIRSHYFNPKNKSPVSIFLIGRTGTGKTEMAKAIANVVYGPMNELSKGNAKDIGSDKIEIISMGNITNTHMANNVFGSPKGHVGSEEDAEFESALKKLPGGGVIVFDEFSNVGGGNPTEKNAILKRFYEIFDEGIWISPRGTKYDLSKYIFVSTGNDGEQLFFDGSNDDLLMSTWKNHSSKDKVLEILRDSNFPEALAGRFSEVFLTKPLLSKEREAIVERLLKDELDSLTITHGFKVEVAADFYSKVEKAFFNHKQGARSIRNFVKNQVTGVLIKAVTEKYDPIKIKNSKVVLTMKDNMPDLPFVDESFRRSTTLNAKVFPNTQAAQAAQATQAAGTEAIYDFEVTSDITQLANKKMLVSKSVAENTAYHEVGHALVNNKNVSGKNLDFLTILPGDGHLGYARYQPVDTFPSSPGLTSIISEIAQLVAGSVAERMTIGKNSSGWSDDLRRARLHATDAIVKYGLVKGFEAIPVDDKGRPQLGGKRAAALDQKVDDLINMGLIYAKLDIQNKWPLGMKIVTELMKKGSISGEEFKSISDRFEIAKKNKEKTFDGISMSEKAKYADIDVTTIESDFMAIDRLHKELFKILKQENPSLYKDLIGERDIEQTIVAEKTKRQLQDLEDLKALSSSYDKLKKQQQEASFRAMEEASKIKYQIRSMPSIPSGSSFDTSMPVCKTIAVPELSKSGARIFTQIFSGILKRIR
ncbi:MAG: AAA family ATPase [Oligoflexia bacterium]|nr:AAA family ATPase [Oligoflexia bacterium]